MRVVERGLPQRRLVEPRRLKLLLVAQQSVAERLRPHEHPLDRLFSQTFRLLKSLLAEVRLAPAIPMFRLSTLRVSPRIALPGV